MSFNWKRNDDRGNNWTNNSSSNNNNNRGGHQNRFQPHNNRNNNFRKQNNSNAWPGGGLRDGRGEGNFGYQPWFSHRSPNPGFNFHQGSGNMHMPPYQQFSHYPEPELMPLLSQIQMLPPPNIHPIKSLTDDLPHQPKVQQQPHHNHQKRKKELKKQANLMCVQQQQQNRNSNSFKNDDHQSNNVTEVPSTSGTPKTVKSNTVEAEPEIETKSAEHVTKKVFQQLHQMKKHDLKQIISNPSSIVETALKTHAQKKIREEMRKQLKNFSHTDPPHSTSGDDDLQLRPDDIIDSDKIPDAILGLLDINLSASETSMDNVLNENANPRTYTEDLYSRAEALLMQGSAALLDASNMDSAVDPAVNEFNSYINEFVNKRAEASPSVKKVPPEMHSSKSLLQNSSLTPSLKPVKTNNCKKNAIPSAVALDIELERDIREQEIIANNQLRVPLMSNASQRNDVARAKPVEVAKKKKDNIQTESVSQSSQRKKVMDVKIKRDLEHEKKEPPKVIKGKKSSEEKQHKSSHYNRLKLAADVQLGELQKPKEPIDLMTKLRNMNAIKELYSKHSQHSPHRSESPGASQNRHQTSDRECSHERRSGSYRKERKNRASYSRSRSRERKKEKKHRDDDERDLRNNDPQQNLSQSEHGVDGVVKLDLVNDEQDLNLKEAMAIREEILRNLASEKLPAIVETTKPISTINGDTTVTNKEQDNVDSEAVNGSRPVIINDNLTGQDPLETRMEVDEEVPILQTRASTPNPVEHEEKVEEMEIDLPVESDAGVDEVDVNQTEDKQPEAIQDALLVQENTDEISVDLPAAYVEINAFETNEENNPEIERITDTQTTIQENIDGNMSQTDPNKKASTTIESPKELIVLQVTPPNECLSLEEAAEKTLPPSQQLDSRNEKEMSPHKTLEENVKNHSTITTETPQAIDQSEKQKEHEKNTINCVDKSDKQKKQQKNATSDELKKKLQLVVEASKSSKFETRQPLKLMKSKDDKPTKKKQSIQQVVMLEASQLFCADLPKPVKQATVVSEKNKKQPNDNDKDKGHVNENSKSDLKDKDENKRKKEKEKPEKRRDEKKIESLSNKEKEPTTERPKESSTHSHKVSKEKGQKSRLEQETKNVTRKHSLSPSPQQITTVREKDSQETRLWRSPGEKKCMTESSNDSISSSIVMKHASVNLERANLNQIDEAVDEKAHRMKVIDVQLMKLHQERMEIEKEISKLQQNKITIDEQTMELQKERMTLVDSLLVTKSTVQIEKLPPVQQSKDRQPATTLERRPPSVVESGEKIDLTLTNTKSPKRSRQQKKSTTRTRINQKKSVESSTETVIPSRAGKRKRFSEVSPSTIERPKRARYNVSVSETDSTISIDQPLQLGVTALPIVQKITKIKRSHVLSILEKEKKRFDEIQSITAPLPASSSKQKRKSAEKKNSRRSKKQEKRVAVTKNGFKIIDVNSELFKTITSRHCRVVIEKHITRANSAESLIEIVDEIDKLTDENIDDNIDNLMPTLELLGEEDLLSTNSLDLTELTFRNDFDSLFSNASEKVAWNGEFVGHNSAICCMEVHNQYLLAASMDGIMYRYNWATGALQKSLRLHTDRITAFIVHGNHSIYTVSKDSFIKKIDLEHFDRCLNFTEVGEELQTMDCKYNRIYLGTNKGNVYIYDIEDDLINDHPLCVLNEPIMEVKLTTIVVNRDAKDFLIVSPETSQISIRDASSGMLLHNVASNINVYSMVVDEQFWDSFGGTKSILYCRTYGNELVSINVTTGQEDFRFKCKTRGNCMKIWKNFIMVSCEDDYVYVFNKFNGQEEARIPTFGSSLLTLDFIDNKILGSSKDRILKIWDIPQEILSLSNEI